MFRHIFAISKTTRFNMQVSQVKQLSPSFFIECAYSSDFVFPANQHDLISAGAAC